jgi:hypothetical protein
MAETRLSAAARCAEGRFLDGPPLFQTNGARIHRARRCCAHGRLTVSDANVLGETRGWKGTLSETGQRGNTLFEIWQTKLEIYLML